MQDDRWEYRIWPEDAALLSRTMADHADEELAAEFRTDHYLLPADDRINAKIRGGELFEIKELLETRQGAEHWMMVISQTFPVGAKSFEQLLGDARDMPTARALIDAAQESLQVFEVRKHRRRFALGAAEGEIVSIMTGEHTASSLCIEAPDPETCLKLGEELGFAEFDNIGYGTYLRGLST